LHVGPAHTEKDEGGRGKKPRPEEEIVKGKGSVKKGGR